MELATHLIEIIVSIDNILPLISGELNAGESYCHFFGMYSEQKGNPMATGSGHTWLAAIGPNTPQHGEMKSKSQHFQQHFAKTALAFLVWFFTTSNLV